MVLLPSQVGKMPRRMLRRRHVATCFIQPVSGLFAQAATAQPDARKKDLKKTISSGLFAGRAGNLQRKFLGKDFSGVYSELFKCFTGSGHHRWRSAEKNLMLGNIADQAGNFFLVQFALFSRPGFVMT